MKSKVRIMLAEDHTLVRSGIRALLEGANDIDVVGEVSNGRRAVELCAELHPQVVLMDVAMPELGGIEATRQIRATSPDTRILMLSMYDDRQYVFESIKAGASGYILKDSAFTVLLGAIRTVLDGRTFFSPSLVDGVMNDYVLRAQGTLPSSDLDKLSAREREVLQLVAEGHSSSEVAGMLHISVRTVDTHRYNIMEKLQIHSIAGLTKFSLKHGLSSLR